MLSAERKLYILKKLESEQTIQVKQIAKELHVSESSIRRDLLELDDENKVDRIYGGAVKKERERILTDEAEIKMMERMSIHYDKKLRICKAASTLVEDGECVFLDGGTSIVPMIHFLSSRPIKIVTNNHLIVQNVQNPKAKIIVIGGEFNTKYRMSEGNEAQNMLRLYNFDRAFIGCAGVNLGMKKAFTAEMATRELKRIAMELSNHNYLLIDDSKLHVKGFCTFAQLDEFEDVFINRTTGMETLQDHFIAVK